MIKSNNNLRNIAEKINRDWTCRFQEPMSLHTTFKTGGPADLFLLPKSTEQLKEMVQFFQKEEIPWMILGGGANILASDKGIEGAVICTTLLSAVHVDKNSIRVEAGTDVSDMCRAAAKESLTGLEFIFGMPGTLGGAVRMNVRCYGASISDHLEWVDYLDEDDTVKRLIPREGDFAYKVSPFQCGKKIILEARFKLKKGKQPEILDAMEKNKADREQKGHFTYPCAGSVFKNNRDFGAPSGVLIDSIGLKGVKIGGAQIAEYHGNIIVNRDGATSEEIYKLIILAEDKVQEKLGFHLEPEVLLVGRWDLAD